MPFMVSWRQFRPLSRLVVHTPVFTPAAWTGFHIAKAWNGYLLTTGFLKEDKSQQQRN